MRFFLASLFAVLFIPAIAKAQRDPPLYESSLASATVYHDKDDALSLNLLYRKYGGPQDHEQHQMYLLAYLKKEESKVMEIATKPEYLVKGSQAGPLFLDVLLEKKLAVILDSKVATKRDEHDARDAEGKKVPTVDMVEGRSSLNYFSFSYDFKISEKSLLESVNKLPRFDAKNEEWGGPVLFGNEIRLIAFVPTNDCKYADKVTKEAGRGESDVGVPHDRKIAPSKPGGAWSTPILLFKSLPYDLRFARWGEKKISVLIH